MTVRLEGKALLKRAKEDREKQLTMMMLGRVNRPRGLVRAEVRPLIREIRNLRKLLAR